MTARDLFDSSDNSVFQLAWEICYHVRQIDNEMCDQHMPFVGQQIHLQQVRIGFVQVHNRIVDTDRVMVGPAIDIVQQHDHVRRRLGRMLLVLFVFPETNIIGQRSTPFVDLLAGDDDTFAILFAKKAILPKT